MLETTLLISLLEKMRNIHALNDAVLKEDNCYICNKDITHNKISIENINQSNQSESQGYDAQLHDVYLCKSCTRELIIEAKYMSSNMPKETFNNDSNVEVPNTVSNFSLNPASINDELKKITETIAESPLFKGNQASILTAVITHLVSNPFDDQNNDELTFDLLADLLKNNHLLTRLHLLKNILQKNNNENIAQKYQNNFNSLNLGNEKNCKLYVFLEKVRAEYIQSLQIINPQADKEYLTDNNGAIATFELEPAPSKRTLVSSSKFTLFFNKEDQIAENCYQTKSEQGSSNSDNIIFFRTNSSDLTAQKEFPIFLKNAIDPSFQFEKVYFPVNTLIALMFIITSKEKSKDKSHENSSLEQKKSKTNCYCLLCNSATRTPQSRLILSETNFKLYACNAHGLIFLKIMEAITAYSQFNSTYQFALNIKVLSDTLQLIYDALCNQVTQVTSREVSKTEDATVMNISGSDGKKCLFENKENMPDTNNQIDLTDKEEATAKILNYLGKSSVVNYDANKIDTSLHMNKKRKSLALASTEKFKKNKFMTIEKTSMLQDANFSSSSHTFLSQFSKDNSSCGDKNTVNQIEANMPSSLSKKN
ncbi:MAG: hypothetical protein Tsb005_15510 [Gammaproteobacteria bacterium]